MHNPAILADIAVAKVNMGLAIHHPHNGGARNRQVLRVDIVRDQGPRKLVGTITEQGLAGITDKGNAVVPVDHKHRVQHQMDQFGIERLQVNGHNSGCPIGKTP